MATREQWNQYQMDKDVYERKLIEYEASLRRWHSLSKEDRAKAHTEAEASSRVAWSLGVAALISIVMYFEMQKQYAGDNFWLMWGGASVVIAIFAVLGSKVLGLLARSCFFASATGAIFYFGVGFLQHNTSNPPSDELKFWAVTIASLLAFILALVSYRASGEPSAPTPPTRPT